MIVKLTGPREGQTVMLNGSQFVNGIAHIDDGAFRYFSRCYGVVPHGLSDNEAADPERGGKTVSGKPELQPEGRGTPEGGAQDSVGDDAGVGGEAEQLPSGDGHGDAGFRGPIEGDDPLGQALRRINTENNDLWTGTGRPTVKALADVLGRMVTKEEVEARFKGGERVAARQGS